MAVTVDHPSNAVLWSLGVPVRACNCACPLELCACSVKSAAGAASAAIAVLKAPLHADPICPLAAHVQTKRSPACFASQVKIAAGSFFAWSFVKQLLPTAALAHHVHALSASHALCSS